MRAAPPLPGSRSGFRFRSLTRSALQLSVALGLALAPACAGPTKTVQPDPEPTPPPVVAPPPPPAPPPAVATEIIEIHQADLHGQVESKQGTTITIRALLMMTKTQPAVGNKGVLYVSPPGAQSDTEWVALGDVQIQKPLDAGSRLQVKMVDDEKKFMISGGKRPSPLSKNTRVKLRWEW